MTKFKSVQKLKASIRNSNLKKRLSLTQAKVNSASKKILEKLTELQEYKKAKTILLYHPIQNEPDTTPLLSNAKSPTNKASKKTFALIRICGKTNRIHLHKIENLNDLKTGKFNIKEPHTHHPVIAKRNIDIAIIPGIAFDKNGNRIGYGKGYFDRLLKGLSTKCIKIALAYDFQILDNVPAEKHDQKVDFILTEKETIRAK